MNRTLVLTREFVSIIQTRHEHVPVLKGTEATAAKVSNFWTLKITFNGKLSLFIQFNLIASLR